MMTNSGGPKCEPPSVETSTLLPLAPATDEYLESEDAVATWIRDRCELKASYEDTAAELFKSWKEWAELMGEKVGSAKAFGNKLQARAGIKRKAIGHSNARGYSGIRVVKVEQAQPEQSSFYRDD
jgi:phage/plasmid-associated DNA primase